jgi:hypothetical protein
MNQIVPVLFCHAFHANSRSPLQKTKAQRSRVTRKGSRSTAGPQPSSNWLPGPGRGNNFGLHHTARQEGKEGMMFLPLGRWGNRGPR